MPGKRGRNGPQKNDYPSPLTPEERRKRHLERKRKYAKLTYEQRKLRGQARKMLRAKLRGNRKAA